MGLLPREALDQCLSNAYNVVMSDIPGTFEQAVMVAIVRLGAEGYGRRILNDVQERLERNVAAGAVYSTLDRLEAKGLLNSKLAPGTALRGGRARRYYGLTVAGVRALNASRTASESIWRGLAWPPRRRV
jgi:DNA-binding PadR family transcriptional regulator